MCHSLRKASGADDQMQSDPDGEEKVICFSKK